MRKIEIKLKLYMAVFEKLAVEAKNSGAIWFKPRFSFFHSNLRKMSFSRNFRNMQGIWWRKKHGKISIKLTWVIFCSRRDQNISFWTVGLIIDSLYWDIKEFPIIIYNFTNYIWKVSKALPNFISQVKWIKLSE